MAARTYHFTLEAVAKCPEPEVEYWLRVAAHALDQAGFALDDAQAIGIDGAPGAVLDFPDPAPKTLSAPAAQADTRRMADVPGRIR